jgi:hypothetical protein
MTLKQRLLYRLQILFIDLTRVGCVRHSTYSAVVDFISLALLIINASPLMEIASDMIGTSLFKLMILGGIST